MSVSACQRAPETAEYDHLVILRASSSSPTRAEAAIEAYLVAGGVEDAKAPLFQRVDRSRRLSGRSLTRRVLLAMIKRRASAAGLPASTCCHTFQATGITAYLSNGGTLKHAQQIAGHASPRTTKPRPHRGGERAFLFRSRIHFTHADRCPRCHSGMKWWSGMVFSSATIMMTFQ